MSTQTMWRTRRHGPVREGNAVRGLPAGGGEPPDRVALRTVATSSSSPGPSTSNGFRRTAAGLAALGVRPGDRVGPDAHQPAEFFWVDVAVITSEPWRSVSTPRSPPMQITQVLRGAGRRSVASPNGLGRRLRPRARMPPRRARRVRRRRPGMTAYDVLAAGDPGFDLDAASGSIRPTDVVTLVHTSGTTGPPKRVPITHANALASIGALRSALPAYRSGLSLVSFGPLAHVVARVVEHYCCLTLAGTITCCPDLRALPAAMVDARPTACGPAALERAAGRYEAALERGDDPVREREGTAEKAGRRPAQAAGLVEFFGRGRPPARHKGSRRNDHHREPAGRGKVGPSAGVPAARAAERAVRCWYAPRRREPGPTAGYPPGLGDGRRGYCGGRRARDDINTGGTHVAGQRRGRPAGGPPVDRSAVCIGEGGLHHRCWSGSAAGVSGTTQRARRADAAVERANARLYENEAS